MSKMPGAKLTNRVKIDIQLLDSNDNSPVFRPTSHYLFNVSRHVPSGTIIGQVGCFFKKFMSVVNGFLNYQLLTIIQVKPLPT